MSQIVEGGKHVFGISEVHENFQVCLPLEAFYEYRFHEGKVIVLISGSDTLGGFSIHSIDKIKHSRLSVLLETLLYNKRNDDFGVPESSINHYKKRIITWMKLDVKSYFFLGENLAGELKISISDRLVVIRGGNNGPEFITRGPIYEKALLDPDIKVF